MRPGPLWISEADVEALLDPAALVAAMERGIRAEGCGGVREHPSTRLDGLDGEGAYLTLYPAHAAGGMASVKVLAGRPANAREGQPEIDAVVALVAPRTGEIAALVSARALTAYRTAAITAAVLKRLVHRAPVRIGLVGTGTQARAHGRVLAAVGLADGLVIASARGDMARATQAAAEMAAATGLPVRTAHMTDLPQACDAIVLMSLARRPLDLGPLAGDCVIASIGPFYPHAHEIDPALVARAGCVVSDHPDRLRRQWSGSALLDVESLPLVSFADLLAGQAPMAGPRIFLSDGRSFQDNLAASMIHDAALAAGRGVRLP